MRALDILTPAAFKNALALDMALGCSTNTILRLTAIAREAGVDVPLTPVNEISERRRIFADLRRQGALPYAGFI